MRDVNGRNSSKANDADPQAVAEEIAHILSFSAGSHPARSIIDL
jgi:hypothetical protein